jgi:Ras-related protein Rab-28
MITSPKLISKQLEWISLSKGLTYQVFNSEHPQQSSLIAGTQYINRSYLALYICGHNKGGIEVALQIWDIGGQTIGSKMIGNYIYGAQAVILAYDITNYQSFQDLEDWLALTKKTFESEQMPYLALFANKSDLGHMRVVKLEQHNSFAESNALIAYQVSAKSGDAVNNSFIRIAADLAGIVLTKNDLEAGNKVIEAQIVNHAQNDPAQPKLVLKEDKKKCSIQ